MRLSIIIDEQALRVHQIYDNRVIHLIRAERKRNATKVERAIYIIYIIHEILTI